MEENRLTFIRLTEKKFVGNRWRKHALYRCSCDDKIIERCVEYVSGSRTRSCGCLGEKNGFKHGKIYTKKYKSWSHCKERCTNPNCKSYNDYGGRGIKICDRWLDFRNFDQDMPEPPSSKHTLHRINNEGNYEPGNCKWATPLEQGADKRNNKNITFNNKTQILAEWSREINIQPDTLSARIYKRNWSIEKALTTPVRKGKHNAK